MKVHQGHSAQSAIRTEKYFGDIGNNIGEHWSYSRNFADNIESLHSLRGAAQGSGGGMVHTKLAFLPVMNVRSEKTFVH